jgi:predicted PurR-regulated permease PerM
LTVLAQIGPAPIGPGSPVPILLGVLTAVFGLVGLFLEPIVIAVWLAAWHEWIVEQAPPPPGQETPHG